MVTTPGGQKEHAAATCADLIRLGHKEVCIGELADGNFAICCAAAVDRELVQWLWASRFGEYPVNGNH